MERTSIFRSSMSRTACSNSSPKRKEPLRSISLAMTALAGTRIWPPGKLPIWTTVPPRCTLAIAEAKPEAVPETSKARSKDLATASSFRGSSPSEILLIRLGYS
jgi:hypothetical protein